MSSNKYILLGVAILLVIFLGMYFITKDERDNAIACTEEALQCPDGTYVERAGAQCQFTACRGVSFVGTLVQDSSGFRLHIDAPLDGTQEVVYVLPIEIKVSNVLGQVVGKMVTVFGSFSTGNKFIVDRLQEMVGTAGDPTIGNVGVGKSVLINGVRVTLNSVVQDSRCPIDVQCIEAGAINTNVTLQSNTDKVTRNMPSDEVPIQFDSYRISIVGILPPRVSKTEVKPADYVVTFKVESNK